MFAVEVIWQQAAIIFGTLVPGVQSTADAIQDGRRLAKPWSMISGFVESCGDLYRYRLDYNILDGIFLIESVMKI
jgi:hypothetical protein